MFNRTYKIKPLEWVESKNYDDKTTYKATTSRGDYEITETEWLGDLAWFWQYTFCDYYDEGSGNLPDLAEAKAHCEALWLGRVEADLIEVQPEATS